MGLFEHFPYTNFHDLNLDWILRHIKSLRDRLEELIKEYNKTKVPGGGLKNQVLTKNSDTDYDMSWKNSSGIPAGGNTGEILTKNSAADFDAGWSADNNIKKSGGTLDNAATLEFVDGADSAEIGAKEILATGEKFQFSGKFGFTSPVSGQPPVADNDLATKQYVDASTSSVDGVPAGGTAGQVLTKKTAADGDTEWTDPSGGGDYLPLAGGTMNEVSEIKWAAEFKIGIDETGTRNAKFRGANVECDRVALINGSGTKVLYIDQAGFDQSGLTSDFRIGASFPRWVFANDVRATKTPTDDTSVVNKKYADSLAIPIGGTTGQVLGKKSDSDRDCGWISAPTPDIPNLSGAFAYQLPFISTGVRTDISGITEKLTSFFGTSYGIMTLSLNNPDLNGGMTAGAKYCLGLSSSVYVPLGATTKIPLYGVSDGAVKQVALLEFEIGGKAYITLMNSVEPAAALSAYIAITDFKVQKWFNN